MLGDGDPVVPDSEGRQEQQEQQQNGGQIDEVSGVAASAAEAAPAGEVETRTVVSMEGGEATVPAGPAGGAAEGPAAEAAKCSAAVEAAAPEKPLSKNAQKKLQKQQQNRERREMRREEKRRQREAAEAAAATAAAGGSKGPMSLEEKAAAEERAKALQEQRQQAAAAKVAAWQKSVENSPRVIIDLGFEELMTQRELSSLQQQIMFSYGLNCRAAKPLRLHLSHCTGKILANLERISGFDRWRIERDERPYLETFGDPASRGSGRSSLAGGGGSGGGDQLGEGERNGDASIAGEGDGGIKRTEGRDGAKADGGSEGPASVQADQVGGGLVGGGVGGKESLVYLTSDAEEELQSLDRHKSYIIGGIVDHNRHKGITAKKAKEQGIATARLPPALFPSLTTSKVLTVNQVFEALVCFWATGDWSSALHTAIPNRKKTSSRTADGQGKGGGVGGEDGEASGEDGAGGDDVRGGEGREGEGEGEGGGGEEVAEEPEAKRAKVDAADV